MIRRFHFRDAFGVPTWEPDPDGASYELIGSSHIARRARLLVRPDVRLTALDLALVARLREACAVAFKMPPGYPYFSCDYRPGEAPNVALLRMYRAERLASNSEERAFDALIYG